MRYKGLALDYALGADVPLTITRDGWLVERVINDPATKYSAWWCDTTPEGRLWRKERQVIETLAVAKPGYMEQFKYMMLRLREVFDAKQARCAQCRKAHEIMREAAMHAAVDQNGLVGTYQPIDCPHRNGPGERSTTGKRSKQVGYKDPNRTKGGFGSRLVTGKSAVYVNYREVGAEIAALPEKEAVKRARAQAIADMQAEGVIDE